MTSLPRCSVNICLIYQMAQELRLRQRRAGEGLDVVHQAVGRLRRALLVAAGDRPRDIGMEPRGKRQIGGLLVVNVPEAARQALHEQHRASGELVARGLQAEKVELAIEAHEDSLVVAAPSLLHPGGDLGETGALDFGRPPRRTARDQALELAPHLEQPQLGLDVDLGDQDAAARHDHHEALARQALDRLANRRAADLEPLAEHRLGDHRPGCQLEGDDLLLDRAVGAVGHRLVGQFGGVLAGRSRRYARRRGHLSAASISAELSRQALSRLATLSRMKPPYWPTAAWSLPRWPRGTE